MTSPAASALGWLSRAAAIVLSTFGILPGQQTSEAAAGAPERRVQVVDLGGTPYERGLQHGRALKRQIAELLPLWERDVAQQSGATATEFLEWFLAETSYDEAIRKHCPELLDEVRGLAVGAGQDFDTMFAYQLIDEFWVQARLWRRHKCTTVGVAKTGEQPTIVAQNLDVPKWMHTYPTVLRIRHSDSDLSSLVVTVPGLIGAMGLNSGQVGVGVNTILQLSPCRDGLPVAFVVRGVLQQKNVAAARAFAKRVRHASGQAYTIGGPEDVTCYESSANAVVPFVPPTGPDRVWHTNHPEASTDYAPAFVAWIEDEYGIEAEAVDYGCTRLPAMANGLRPEVAADGETIVGLLKDRTHGVCNHATYTCVVLRLGDDPSLRLSAGAADVAKFTTVRLPK